MTDRAKPRSCRIGTTIVAALVAGSGLIGTVQAQGQPVHRETPAGTDLTTTDSLLAGFRDPPADARPRTWWHWMNGNVTQDGIRADLEWMQRVGFGGVHYFDAGGILANYRFVEPRLVVGDANWRSAVKLAASTAERLGMEFATAASPGWSATGGPWVTPEQAMKKLVWSELVVDGGRPLRGALPLPPRTTGPFQDAPLDTKVTGAPEFYRDAKVIAYRIPKASMDLRPERAEATSGLLDPAKLSDGRFAETQNVQSRERDTPVWITLSFARPVTARGLLLGAAGPGASGGTRKPTIETSNDGRSWRAAVTLDGPADAVVKSYGFAPLTARFYRITLPPPPTGLVVVGMPQPLPGITRIALSELKLLTDATIDRFAEKAGFSEPIDYSAAPTAPAATATAIARADVVDLTARLRTDGTLDWTPPRGRWRVLRMGYSLTGKQNGPAPVEATGLEVDKFSVRHTDAYLAEYLGRFEKALGPELIGRRGLRNLLSDSWEAGVQNWTDDMPAEFARRRGYDMTPWLPVLTGLVVDTPQKSDRFLWDFRRTLMDLLAQHYSLIHAQLEKRGIGYYAEAQGDNWRAIADGMELKSRADIPMAEYWYKTFAAGPGQPSLKADMKEAASVAHILGKPLIANESLTVFALADPWSLSPAMLKPVVDEIFAHGINRLVLHTSVHQPLMDRKPGLSLGPFGQFMSRNDTWAEQAKPFLSYIARSSFLLQQGRHVADVAYFYGEERPIVSLFGGQYDAAADRLRIEVPEGYGYDFVNAELLRESVYVEDGLLKTRGGAAYHILFMRPDVERLSLPTLRRIAELVGQGMTLVGPRPRASLGLAGDDIEFARLVDTLWGTAPGVSGRRAVGAGTVYWGMALQDALAAERIAPDVVVQTVGGSRANVLQLHRRLADGSDIFFLSNRLDEPADITASVRSTGRAPELWHADTGLTDEAGYRVESGRTVIPLRLAAREAVFVVMRRPDRRQQFALPAPTGRRLAALEEGWTLAFPPGLGAPTQIQKSALRSWTDSPDDGVRHFSGTATYRNVLAARRDWFVPGRRILLSLGTVRDLAEVTINGRALPIAWKPPYVVDVTDALQKGRNRLEVKVTNLWANRLIGDAAKPGTDKVTWSAKDASRTSFTAGWRAAAPLLPSGLMGPVTVEALDR